MTEQKKTGIDLLKALPKIPEYIKQYLYTRINENDDIKTIYHRVAEIYIIIYDGTLTSQKLEFVEEAIYKYNLRSPNVLIWLANIYKYGRHGVEINRNKVFELYSIGDTKNANIATGLSSCYDNGIGCEKDEEKAFELALSAYQNPNGDKTETWKYIYDHYERTNDIDGLIEINQTLAKLSDRDNRIEQLEQQVKKLESKIEELEINYRP